MVAISKSGSGEGPGEVTPRAYSTRRRPIRLIVIQLRLVRCTIDSPCPQSRTVVPSPRPVPDSLDRRS